MLDERKETLGTTVLDGNPIRRLPMPADTLYPLFLALTLALVFAGILVGSALLALAGLLGALVAAAGWIWPKGEFPESAA